MFDEVCESIRSINKCPSCNNVLHEVHTKLSYFRHIHCTDCYNFSFIIQPHMFDNNHYEIRIKYLKLTFYINMSDTYYSYAYVFHSSCVDELSQTTFQNSIQTLDYIKNINTHYNKILRLLVLS